LKTDMPTLARRLSGAVLLGFATVLLPKTRPDDHWSTTPKVQMCEETDAESTGNPNDG
jgi:hypothetical protein